MPSPRNSSLRGPRELSLNARGLTLSALAFGRPERPLLVALHGWLDNAASFLPLAAMLDAYYVVAIDLPGHGKSEFRPQGASYFHADYALDVAHAVRELGQDPFILMGHSMGGGVATLVAAAMPDQVSHLVLIDGVGPYSDAPEHSARQLMRAVTQSLKASAGTSGSNERGPKRYDSLEALLARRANVSADVDLQALALIVERNARCCTDESGVSEWEWTTDPRLKLASPTRLTHDAVLSILRDIKAPVLNLLASSGMMSQHLEIDRRTAQLANAKTVTIDGHHHFHLDGAVDLTAELVLGFLDDVEPFGRVTA